MPGTNLTREEAATRSALVEVDRHDVELDVTRSEQTFATTSTIHFTCAQPGGETFLDFVGESVEAITVNGTELDPATHYADSRVHLAGLASENVVTVRATGRFTNTGEGLHRFVDPVDDEVYLYTQFEVPDSRRMFPVFEQPDLKARFTFTVTAPAHWEVVSNNPTPEPEPAGDGSATWRFAPTPRISSYITALVAGPYEVVRDSVTSRAGEVPLGLYCRRSLRPYLDADNLFELTKRGFAFFEEEFDCAYPFEKYDQLFTPEYNMGAMENAGCVTINEMYVFRSRVTEAIVERRALTVLHELAHMWFGNLVTMRWWNDLWLNESFAEWASTTAQAEATEWTDAWTTFGTYEKDWAYTQDELSTTHPIVAEIRDLEDVEVNFDGITYAKGASVLKQLVAYVGREPFRDGLRAYFATHAWGNTTLDDLLTELEATSGRDLRTWSKYWLETSGANVLRPLVDVDDRGRITSATIEQTRGTLRPHRLAVGLYEVRDEVLVRTDRLELDVSGERTDVPELVGRQQPDLLLVNDDDLTYAKLRLDERSLATALVHARGFERSLPRALVLASAWDMMREAEMSARSFADLVLGVLPGERDSTLLRTLLSHLQVAVFRFSDPAAPRGHPAGGAPAAVGDGVRRRAPAATPSSSWSRRGPASPPSTTTPRRCARCWRAPRCSTGCGSTSSCAGRCSPRWPRPGTPAPTRSTPSAVARTPPPAASGPRGRGPPGPPPRPRPRRGRPPSRRTPCPTPSSRRWRPGFTRSGTPAEVLAPYVERYHEALLPLSRSRSHALVEAIVLGFYPRSLADRRPRRRHPGLARRAPGRRRRRCVVWSQENRDPVVRALAAQERDARG